MNGPPAGRVRAGGVSGGMMAAIEDTSQTASPAAGGSRASQLTGGWAWFYRGMAVALGLFAVWSAGPGNSEENFHLGFYTLVTWILTLLLFPGRKGAPWRPPSRADLLLAAGLTALIAYSIWRADAVSEKGVAAADWIGWTAAAGLAAVSLRRPQAINFALKGLAILCLGYFIYHYLELQDWMGAWTSTDFWMAFLAIGLSLESARRG